MRGAARVLMQNAPRQTVRCWTAGHVSPWRAIPANIERPYYSSTGLVLPAPPSATVADAETIDALRAAGRLARRMLDFACSLAAPGVSTDAIDDLYRLATERFGITLLTISHEPAAAKHHRQVLEVKGGGEWEMKRVA